MSYKKYTKEEHEMIMEKRYPDRIIAAHLGVTTNAIKMYRKNHKKKEN